ncbi:MAG: DUF4292 domain-containing protein [Flavobacteriales bacterium]|nr:DUF4292 domain-containing protein [Flavobacteriales bacterium]
MKVPAAALVLALLLGACSSTKPVAEQRHSASHPPTTAEIFDLLAAEMNKRPGYLSARAEVSLDAGKGNRSFKAHLRVVHDSAIWISVTPALGIEVARALLTHDSLMIMDKLNDQYWRGTHDQAQARFGVRPNLALLQDAFMGLPIGLDSTERYRSSREDSMYTLASKERRRFIRAAEDIMPGDTLEGGRELRERRLERILRQAERKEMLVYKYWIDPDSLCLQRVLITDLARDQQADVRYMMRKAVKGYRMPTGIALTLSAPGQTASGGLRLERIEINEPLTLPFRIPEKFTPMEP